MITIERTDDFALIKELLSHPKLWREISDDTSVAIKDKWMPDPTWLYLLAKRDDEIVGVVAFHALNGITVMSHIHILPKFWGERLDEVIPEVRKWLKLNTKVKKVVSTVPADCKQVLEAVKRYGFNMEGFSPKSIERKGHVVGQYLFGMEIS